MKYLAQTAAIVFLYAVAAFAQNPCAHVVPLTNQTRIVQHNIRERIDESVGAAEAKDLAASTHYFAPDLTLRLVDGTLLDRKQLEAGMKRDPEWTLSVSDQTSVAIECLELKGPEAVVVTNQHFVRTVPDRKDGSPHELVTNVTHRETWVHTQSGWLTERIEEVKQGPTFLDGAVCQNSRKNL